MRLAIGWHLFYEGRVKIASQATESPFSAETYLRNATGPLAGTFRGMVPDPDGRERLSYDSLADTWTRQFQHAARHYQFDEPQRERGQELLDQAKEAARSWFDDLENQERIREYNTDLAEVRRAAADPPEVQFQRERLEDRRVELETIRRELMATVDGWTESLHQGWAELAAEQDQLRVVGPYRPEPTELDRVNAMTMYGLLIIGICLIAGFLTPVAALAGAGLLFMFYISMPPWPGLPPNPQAEGSYLFVNKNLIEMFALLALAATPNGLWFGVDALLFGWIDRRRARAEAARLREQIAAA